MGVNFNGVESKRGGSGGLPPGNYIARITDAKAIFANSGSEGLGVTFEVVAGEEAGSKIDDSMWFTPKALPYAKYRIETAGAVIPGGEFEVSDNDPDFRRMCASMIGARVKINVGMEADRNDPTKSWPRVKSWEKPDGADPGIGGTAPAGSAATRDDSIPF